MNKRMLSCPTCDAKTESRSSHVVTNEELTGWAAVFVATGHIEWFCPVCTTELKNMLRPLVAFLEPLGETGDYLHWGSIQRLGREGGATESK